MKSAAFFDLDNTIVRGGSLFHLARGLRQQQFFGRGEFLRFFWQELRFVVVGKEHKHDKERIRAAALRIAAGHPIEQLEQLAEVICEDFILPKVYSGTRTLAKEHLDRGEEVWIITASPVRVAQILARRLELTGALGTDIEVVDGKITGELNGPILHGAEKAQALRDFAESRGFDLALCTAYSDSFNDRPLLEAVGKAIAVNPDRRLRRLAKRSAWPIYDFRKMRLARQYGWHAAAATLLALIARMAGRA